MRKKMETTRVTTVETTRVTKVETMRVTTMETTKVATLETESAMTAGMTFTRRCYMSALMRTTTSDGQG